MRVRDCRLATKEEEGKLYYLGLPVPVVFVDTVHQRGDVHLETDRRFTFVRDSSLRVYLAYLSPDGICCIVVED